MWGAFQKAGARIRLTPQFGNVETGETFNVNKIDGTLDQIFELQDRIVTELAEILRIELTSFETEQIAKPQTARVTAYELYARGKQSFLVFGKESARAAAEYFRQAIVIDPNYAQAWAGLGSLLMPKYISSGNAADLDDGVHALQRAMQLDPSLGEPYAFLAYMLMQQHRYDDAIEAARASLDRDPGAFMGWYLLGAPLLGRGLGRGTLDDMARAILPLLRCRTLNPAFHPAQMTAGLIYRLRGQYAHAAYLLDEAVALERAGAGHVFLGAFVERAIIHANSGELPAALALLDMAIPKYSAMDHVYAETMTAWACFSRGRLMERAQDYSGAARDYENACQVAEANDHRLGIGSHWVRAKLGLARLAFRRGEHSVSDSLVTEATRMLKAKDRFVWINLIGCSQAESYYEVAATHALRDEAGTALEALELAIRFGWSDPHQVNHDPCFDGKRDSQPVRQLMARAASLVTLPAPFGAGGFPDLGEPGIAHVPSLRAG